MIVITSEQLKLIAPKADPKWVDALNFAMYKFGIGDNVERVSMFLAQCAYESAEFSRLQENLNYSADRLMAVWPKRFPTQEVADKYAHNPHALADFVYANRGGNGDEASGDGYKYRGRGLIQLTFRDHYVAFAKAIGNPLIPTCPDMLCTKEQASLSAAWFWNTNELNFLADDHPGDDQNRDFVNISRAVNGGTVGAAGRQKYLQSAQYALGISTGE